jgi:hypothetical protein
MGDVDAPEESRIWLDFINLNSRTLTVNLYTFVIVNVSLHTPHYQADNYLTING